jgi:uncharacterized repeat protein (TIGR03803 family)
VKAYFSDCPIFRPATSKVSRPGRGLPFRVVAVVCLFFSAAFVLFTATTTRAQTYTLLANFGGQQPSDLTLSGSTLYGTTQGGGTGNGTVFQVETNGTGLASLHLFSGGNDDGGSPSGTPALTGSTLYGTTISGGNSYGDGTVYQVSTNGSGYKILFSFVPWVGVNPFGALTISGTQLFGLTTAGNGTLFTINTDGTGCTDLHNFGGSVTSIVGSVTNVFLDGSSPNNPLLLSGSTLYGTTSAGGSNGYGTVFQMNTDGSGYSILHYFSNTPGDGYNPHSALILSGSTLYGTTVGDARSNGSVFKINTNGTGFAILYGFGLTAADGYNPYGPLTLSGATLYGTTKFGGSNNFGTVFQINTDGTGYQVLYNFGGGNGAYPAGSLILSDSTVYGIVGGFMFSLAVPPVPTAPTSSVFAITGIAEQGNDVLITWTSGVGSTNALQGTTNTVQATANANFTTNDFADIFIVTNTVSSVTNYLDAGAVTNFSSRYYRVRLVP